MKEFDVTITETLVQSVTVEASSREEAMQMVEDMWHDGDIALDPDDFIDVSYSADEGREIDPSNEIDVLLVKPGQYAFFSTFRFACPRVFAVLNGENQFGIILHAKDSERQYPSGILL